MTHENEKTGKSRQEALKSIVFYTVNPISADEKWYFWVGGNQPFEERNTSNVMTRRFFAQGEQAANGDKFFYGRDHLGSVRELIDNNVQVQAQYDYDSYGRRTKVSGSLDTVVGYTGHHWHEKSGLYLTWYRQYDPNLGRWLSRDPIEENGGVNLYGYCENNPVNYVDPKGLEKKVYEIWCKCCGDKEWRKVKVRTIPARERRPDDSLRPLIGRVSTTFGPSTIHTAQSIWDELVQQQDDPNRTPNTHDNPAMYNPNDPYNDAGHFAHECGHTCQAKRLGPLYIPIVGPQTLFDNSPAEQGANNTGQFGGIVR